MRSRRVRVPEDSVAEGAVAGPSSQAEQPSLQSPADPLNELIGETGSKPNNQPMRHEGDRLRGRGRWWVRQRPDIWEVSDAMVDTRCSGAESPSSCPADIGLPRSSLMPSALAVLCAKLIAPSAAQPNQCGVGGWWYGEGSRRLRELHGF